MSLQRKIFSGGIRPHARVTKFRNNLYIFDQLQSPPQATGISEILSCILNNFKTSMLNCETRSASAIRGNLICSVTQ